MTRRIAFVLGAALAATLALFGVTASASNAAPTSLTCNGNYSNVTVSSVTVPSWASCRLSNSTVLGSVTANPNSEFDTCNDSIAGSVNATQSYTNIDNATSITGSLNLTRPGTTLAALSNFCLEMSPGFVGGYSAYVCPHYVGGSINVLNAPWSNYLWVSIGDCGPVSVHGSVTIQGNRQYVEIEQSTIVGSLLCINNWPPAEAYDVTVGGARVGCQPIYKY